MASVLFQPVLLNAPPKIETGHFAIQKWQTLKETYTRIFGFIKRLIK